MSSGDTINYYATPARAFSSFLGVASGQRTNGGHVSPEPNARIVCRRRRRATLKSTDVSTRIKQTYQRYCVARPRRRTNTTPLFVRSNWRRIACTCGRTFSKYPSAGYAEPWSPFPSSPLTSPSVSPSVSFVTKDSPLSGHFTEPGPTSFH